MAETLGSLITDQGERSTYDAVSQCSRCGYCLQACPTYVLTGKEHFSGRGRNQLVRMLIEGKFSEPESAQEALSACLLCGACTSACYAHVRTADLVLEGRRKIRGKTHWLVRQLTRMLEEKPERLSSLLKLGFALKRTGLSRWAASFGILKLLGLEALGIAEAHMDETPDKFLVEHLRNDPELQEVRGASWLYFAACGTNFLLPRVGLATLEVLKRHFGRGAFLDNPCCGLLSYNYGDLESARRLARRNIERFESASRGAAAAAPLVGDCSSCVAHLKAYPQLFPGDPEWKARAEKFSASVRDFIELPAPAPGPAAAGAVTAFHDSCRARHGQGLIEPGRAWARWAAGGAVVELPEAGWCCGGAGAFAFIQPELSEELARRKAAELAAARAERVVTSSTSCLLQLAHGLKKYYPECRVFHVSELANQASQKTAEDMDT